MLDSNDPRAAYLHRCLDDHLRSIFGEREAHENYFGVRVGIGNFFRSDGPVVCLEMLGPYGRQTDEKSAGTYHAKHFKTESVELLLEIERYLEERGCESIGYFEARDRIARRQQTQATANPERQDLSHRASA